MLPGDVLSLSFKTNTKPFDGIFDKIKGTNDLEGKHSTISYSSLFCTDKV